jgi:hypothetical protein
LLDAKVQYANGFLALMDALSLLVQNIQTLMIHCALVEEYKFQCLNNLGLAFGLQVRGQRRGGGVPVFGAKLNYLASAPCLNIAIL